MAQAAKNQEPLFPGLKTPKQVFRELRNYLAGQFVGATRDDALLDEVLKCLFCKLYVESSAATPPPDSADAFEHAEAVRKIFASVRADFPDLYEEDAELLLDPPSIQEVMRNCSFSLLDPATDPIGDAFEVFVGSESRSRSGQFFTPRAVTEFLVRALDVKPGETIIDPACGAGGFLSAVAHHFLSEGVKAKKLSDLATKTFHGLDKDEYLVKLAKIHISLFSRGHPHIVCADSIAMQNGGGPVELPQDGFDVVITNPPFGVKIVAAMPEILRGLTLARKWTADKKSGVLEPSAEVQNRVPPQVLFVERCLDLLKPGGRLGMVVPESLLSNKGYRYVIQYLHNEANIRAVVGMPEALFKTSGKGGTHTKTCLLLADKKNGTQKNRGRIFMAEALWCGHDSRARSIPNNDLPAIADNLARFRAAKRFEESHLGFVLAAKDLRSNVLCPRYYDPEIARELEGLEKTHDLVVFRDLVDSGALEVRTGDELGKLAYGTGDIPFIRTSDISNWELKADPKHGVARSYYESLKKKQDVQAKDILMVKDGTYLVGTCAMVSEYDEEIVFQSHLYKIRVTQGEGGLSPYLLLAVLSSSVVQRQVRSKQFTQDIIDSLGERLYELVLPIPKSPKTKKKVAGMVETALQRRIEAKELVRDAQRAVLD